MSAPERRDGDRTDPGTGRTGAFEHGMIGRRAVLIGAGALAVSGALTSNPAIAALPQPAKPPGSADALLEFFDMVALRRPDRDGNPRPGWIRKWTTAVALRSRGIGAVSHRDDLTSAVARLSTLTRLPIDISVKKRNGSGQITVYYYSSGEMRRLYRDGGTLCMTRTDGRRGRLHYAQVRIGESHADCIDHELMHAVGFDNHWRRKPNSPPVESVLAPRFGPDRTRNFSPWDEAAIRILYDSRMRPRTRRDEALVIAGEIIGEMFARPGDAASGE